MFVDYYEMLELSPNANSVTIERVFRYLAKIYHPDNPDTGNPARFNEILDAHNTLKDPVRRARYDIEYAEHAESHRTLSREAGDGSSLDQDAAAQEKLLRLLYAKRRRSANAPGMGEYELGRLLDCPQEYLDFHVWYLREKGWIRRSEDGFLAITVEGVDRAVRRPDRNIQKLLTEPFETE